MIKENKIDIILCPLFSHTDAVHVLSSDVSPYCPFQENFIPLVIEKTFLFKSEMNWKLQFKFKV